MNKETAAAAVVVDVTLAARPPHRPLSIVPSSFAVNCFSARRRQVESSQLFRCRELTGHTGDIFSMKFSDDGSLLVSGGLDKTVRLWSLNQGRDQWNSMVMEAKHSHQVTCLAFSPDNCRIFSGGHDNKVFIHDTNT